ncbi:MAG: hypothetical protein DMG30_23150 [Acidobacteria bacterium]|nr:MAG: hypothetical protein DMG30_23150 [Acidobacteriota bacterium]
MNKLQLSSAPPLAAHSLNFILSQTTEQTDQREIGLLQPLLKSPFCSRFVALTKRGHGKLLCEGEMCCEQHLHGFAKEPTRGEETL